MFEIIGNIKQSYIVFQFAKTKLHFYHRFAKDFLKKKKSKNINSKSLATLPANRTDRTRNETRGVKI